MTGVQVDDPLAYRAGNLMAAWVINTWRLLRFCEAPTDPRGRVLFHDPLEVARIKFHYAVCAAQEAAR